jgi:hypothetical protein
MENQIHVFEAFAFGLGNKEPGESERQEAEDRKLRLVSFLCRHDGSRLTKKYVPYLMVSSISGVTKPIMKLHIQVAEVVILIARLLDPRLKISAGSTQPIGAKE